MKIAFASDLHLEFLPSWEGVSYRNFGHVDRDVLVLAGDINTGSGALNLITKELQNSPVVYVAGNHEFYGHDMTKVREFWKEVSMSVDDFYFLDNSSAVIDGVTFVGGTLWTNFNNGNPLAMQTARYGMNDYNQIIFHKKRKLSPAIVLSEHKKTIKYIDQVVARGDPSDKFVVVSHMAPSTMSLSKMYNPRLDACYASDLSELILDRKPNLWIHGHVHESRDYMIGDTRVVSNPGGYPYYGDSSGGNSQFDAARIVEV